MFVKDSLNFDHRSDIALSEGVGESVWIQISKEAVDSDKDIVVGVIYRPPDTDVGAFTATASVDDLLQSIQKENK